MPAKKTVNNTRQKARIFTVEDHAISRHGLVRLINQQTDMVVCGEADNVRAALAGVSQSKPDLVTVDLSLKTGSGLDLIKSCHDQHPGIHILVVSMHDETLHAEAVLNAGARGYIMKEEAIENLLAGIRRVLDGKICLSETMLARCLERRLNPSPNKNTASPADILTQRELQVLQFIGEWRKTQDIAIHLGLSIKTIEYYRQRIKQKLQLANAVELTHYATDWMRRKDESEPREQPIPDGDAK